MNYTEALASLYGVGDFERRGTFRNDQEQHLLREGALLLLLGNPQQRYSCTLIAGTKGKGSTAACIESVLRAADVRTGLYTQPDLHTFRERIRVRGQLIREDEVATLLPEVHACVEEIERQAIYRPFIPYEIVTALALLYFQRQRVEHAVLEVGIGGRLDATNVTQPLVSVISSLSFDHMNVLGHTLREIATEKAGIIKPGRVVVCSAQAPEALLAVAHVARERQARLVRVGPASGDPAQAEVEAGALPAPSYRYQPQEHRETWQTFHVAGPRGEYRDLHLSLAGVHQMENATLALAALEEVRASGASGCTWDTAALRQGLQTVHWPARLQIIGRRPWVVVDGAHNADSMQKLVQSLRTLFSFQRLYVVLGCNADKDLPGMVEALAGVDAAVLTRALTPRAAAVERFQTLFAQLAPGVRLSLAADSRTALQHVHTLAGPDDLICATGSLYLAAEVLRWTASHDGARDTARVQGADHACGREIDY
jgi:dihydrofolate synthase/folylpolyglutamate synthase